MSNRHRLPYAALGGCLGVVLGIGIALGQSLNQGDVKGKETPAPTEQRQEAPSAPSVPPAIPAETGSESLYSPDCDSPKSLDEADLCEQRRMADAAYETVEWVRKQYRATIGEIIALVIAIFVATLAVAVAFRANRISKQSAQRQLRAYIVADTAAEWEQAYKGSTDNIVGYNFTMKWNNCGVTPARRCQGWTNLAVFDEMIPSDFDYPDKPGLKTTGTNHIGPGQHFQSKVGGLSIPDAEAAERGEKHAYVWSWLEYDDIFGRVRHRTEVCYELRISKDGGICTPTIIGPFNGADEDCFHKPKT